MTTRRQILKWSAATTAFAGMGCATWVAAQQKEEEVIRIVAKKFEFMPNAITLRKGVPVIIELSSMDVIMGFNCTDLKVRADILPGKTARVRLTPERPGEFAFFCDIFCGSGHEDMNGTITVT